MKIGLIENLSKKESYRRGVLLSTLVNFLVRTTGFLVSLAMAYIFGTGTDTDLYFYSIGLVTLLAGFGGLLTQAVIIPEAMRLSVQNGKGAAMAFLNFFLYIQVGVGGLISVVAVIDPVGVVSVLSRFTSHTILGHAQVVYLSLLLLPLSILSVYLCEVLSSERHFTLSMLSSLMAGLTTLVSVALLHKPLGITSVLVGQIAGSALQLVFVGYLMIKKLAWLFSPCHAAITTAVRRNVFFALAGNSASLLASWVPLYLLSGFETGILSSVNYGQRIADMINMLLSAQIISVVGIMLNEAHARRDWEGLNAAFLSAIRVLLFILIPVSALGFLYADGIITVLLERGAFDTGSARWTSDFFRYLVLLNPFLAINAVVGRLFMSGQKIAEAFRYQIGINVLFTATMFVGVSLYGPMAYPWSLLCIYLLNTVFCFHLVRHYFPTVHYGEIFPFLAKLLLMNGVLTGILALFRNIFPLSPVFMAAGACTYVVLLLLVNRVLCVSRELNEILEDLRKIVVFRRGTGVRTS